MISGKKLHGMRVLDAKGEVLGRVQDLIAEKNSGRLYGFIMITGGMLGRTMFIPANRLLHLGEEGLLLPDQSCLLPLRQRIPNPGELHLGDIRSSRGHITDVIIDERRIAAAELSCGLLSDIRNGRETVLWEDLERLTIKSQVRF